MPAFRTDAPPQIRYAVALFVIVWLIEAFFLSRLLIAGLGGYEAWHIKPMATTLRGFFVILSMVACWLLLNGGLIAGLCHRQRLARLLELLLTIATTIVLIKIALPIKVSLPGLGFFSNALATVLIYSGPCSRWFQSAAHHGVAPLDL